MNKQQALDWLFDKVTKWPTNAKGITSAPIGWKWCKMPNYEIKLIYSECAICEYISQYEWLNHEPEKSEPKKVYISGPMTGYKNFNREEFNARAEQITASGDIALNPAILPDGLSTAEYMQICMSMVMCADEIYLLPDWDESKGAIAELSLAEKLGLTVVEL